MRLQVLCLQELRQLLVDLLQGLFGLPACEETATLRQSFVGKECPTSNGPFQWNRVRSGFCLGEDDTKGVLSTIG